MPDAPAVRLIVQSDDFGMCHAANTGAIEGFTNGIVTQVTDAEILAAKHAIDRVGIGCEPASACSLAGAKKLRDEGVIDETDEVVCVLTGHVLKDPEIVANDAAILEHQLVEIDATIDAVAAELIKIGHRG